LAVEDTARDADLGVVRRTIDADDLNWRAQVSTGVVKAPGPAKPHGLD
jgi:hypothetical protein